MNFIASEYEDVIPTTPQKIKKRKKLKVNIASVLEFAIEPLFNNVIHTSLKNCYKPPFVFYEISDITKLSEWHNSDIKTLGIYKPNLLMDHRCDIIKANLFIKLDLNCLNKIPQYNEAIEVYGLLSPEKVFVVKFWVSLAIENIHQYWINLKMQKLQYLPNCYKEIKVPQHSLFVEDYYFEEIDESNLIHNVESIEELNQDLENLMAIDENCIS